MFTKKTIYTIISFLLLCSLLIGCIPSTPVTVIETQKVIETVVVQGTPQVVEKEIIVTPTTAPVDKEGGTFYYGVPYEFPGFNPILTDQNVELWLFGLDAEPLTWGGENYPTILKPIVAESWEVSNDGKVWTINLRHGVYWHDGVELTADDVVFTAQAIQDPATGERASWLTPRFEVNGVPYKFEAINKYTVQITTAEPIPNLLNLICVPLIPKHYFVENNISNADMANDKFNTEGNIGTGPFKLVEYKRGEAAVLERNDLYWRGKPYLDKIVMRIIPDPSSMVAALKSGEVDWAQITPQLIPQLLDDPNLSFKVLNLDLTRFLNINNTKPMLKDKRVHQAFMYAIDRQAINNTYLLGYGKIPDFPFTPFVYGYKPLPQYEYNLEKAKELMVEVGWEMGTDGIWVAKNVDGVPAGTRFSVTLEAYDRTLPVSILVQSDLKKLGVDVTLNLTDDATFYANNIGKEDKVFDLEMGGGGWLGADASGYTFIYYAGSVADSSTSYYNPAIEELWQKTKAASDPEQKGEYIYQMAEILWDELPVIPLVWESWVFASNNRLHVEEADLNTNLFSLFTYPEKIWVENR
jgi:peptide/nickel transport system substrate-binding protein